MTTRDIVRGGQEFFLDTWEGRVVAQLDYREAGPDSSPSVVITGKGKSCEGETVQHPELGFKMSERRAVALNIGLKVLSYLESQEKTRH